MHDVHYAPNASNMSFPVNATVHSNYNIMDRPLDAYTGTMTSQGPPGIFFKTFQFWVCFKNKKRISKILN